MADTAEDAVYARINRRIVPVILIAYMLAFLDRINVGYTQLQMKEDLGFSDAVYGLGAGIFFLTYTLFEVPSNLWMEKIGARLTFLRIMVLWGLCSTATMFVTEPWHFYGLRMLLGIFEAGFFPGVILYLTYWYPSHRRARVTGWFLFGIPVTGIIGGPISGMIMSRLDGIHALQGWQWVFLLEGLPTVLIGVLVFFLLADKPEKAHWLNDEEKALVRRVIDDDNSGNTEAHGKSQLLAALADPRIYVLSFVYFCIVCVIYAFTFWLPTLIKELGVTSVAAVGWYSVLPYAFGALGISVISYTSDRWRERRWHVGGSLALGATALYLTTILDAPLWPSLWLLSFAAFFIMGSLVFWAIPPTYLGPQKAATGIGVVSALGILGGFVSPALMGWFRTEMGSTSVGLACLVALTIAGAVVTICSVPASAVRVGRAPGH